MAAVGNADVTVVISCFNYGRFLPEAIASAKNQEGGAARIIVVDDGSTEEQTQRVLEDLDRAPDVRLIRQANAGASAARNTGLLEVQTAYAMVLDADDLIPPGALQILRAALESDQKAGYAYGHIEFFGNWSGLMRMPPFDPWRLLFRHIIGPTALMRHEMVEATGGYDTDFCYYEDWEIWLHALAKGWYGLQVNFPGLLQRKHGPSKFAGDRSNYDASFAKLRRKHRTLYGDLPRLARESELSAQERFLYQYVWGPRPWPARLENSLYSVMWRLKR